MLDDWQEFDGSDHGVIVPAVGGVGVIGMIEFPYRSFASIKRVTGEPEAHG